MVHRKFIEGMSAGGEYLERSQFELLVHRVDAEADIIICCYRGNALPVEIFDGGRLIGPRIEELDAPLVALLLTYPLNIREGEIRAFDLIDKIPISIG